jgi:maltose O-acetyltransferase
MLGGKSNSLNRISRYVKLTLREFSIRPLIAHWIVSLIPFGIFGNVRSRIFRLAGFSKISKNVWFHGTPTLRGARGKAQLLEIGERTSVNTPCIWDINGRITIGSRVGIGPESLFITGTHEIGPPVERRGECISADITIGDGVWIGARVTILPGVRIGAGAVIGACALVNRDVEPNTLVAGVPARLVRRLHDATPESGVVVRGSISEFDAPQETIEMATESVRERQRITYKR